METKIKKIVVNNRENPKEFSPFYLRKIIDNEHVSVPCFGYSSEGKVVGKRSCIVDPNIELKTINALEQTEHLNNALKAFKEDGDKHEIAIIHIITTEDGKNMGVLVSGDEFEIIKQELIEEKI